MWTPWDERQDGTEESERENRRWLATLRAAARDAATQVGSKPGPGGLTQRLRWSWRQSRLRRATPRRPSPEMATP